MNHCFIWFVIGLSIGVLGSFTGEIIAVGLLFAGF